MAEKGYLVIADISGYTAFLTQTELDHAEEILNSLINTILESMKSPFIISKLEGDAIFAYALAGSFKDGQTLLEAVENTYCAFAEMLAHMQRNTTCTCKACKMMPTLDLKFVLHHGTFILSNIGGRQELSGPDVILIHRLLKSDITEQTNIKAYSFFTEACAEAMDIGALKEGMQAHSETYEHLGEVNGFVQDLHPIWTTRQEQQRIFVKPDEECWYNWEVEIPLSLVTAWDQFANGKYLAKYPGIDSFALLGYKQGRVTAGSQMHCVHGKDITKMTIVDWQPFEYTTISFVILGCPILMTHYFIPTDKGTKLSVYYSKPSGTNLFSSFLAKIIAVLLKKVPENMRKSGQTNIPKIVNEGLASGEIMPNTTTMHNAPIPAEITDKIKVMAKKVPV